MRYPELVNIFDSYFDFRSKHPKDVLFPNDYVKGKTFFKYCNLTDNTKKNILNHQLYASSITDFNDPFDGNPTYNLLFLSVFASKFFNIHIKMNNPIQKNDFDNRIRKALQIIRENVHAICLTGTFDNLLMWAHYANQSTGICVEYELSESLAKYDTVIAPIIYEEKRFEHDPEIFFPVSNMKYKDAVMSNKKIYGTFLHKSIEWKYEDEYRIFISKSLSSDFTLKFVKIKSIYLGPKIKEEDKNWILNLKTMNDFKNITIYQMNLNNKKYQFDPRKIK